MKTVVRILVVSVLLAVVFPLSLVHAQDGGDEAPNMVPTFSAVYFIPASAGAFEDQGDDIYLLTLEGVENEISWIMTTPVLSIRTFDNYNLVGQWAAAEGLVTNAVLQVEDLNVLLSLSSPTYDMETGTQTYVASVDEIISLGDVKDPELPMTFDAVNLSIEWSPAFQDGLILGIEAMYEDFRATPAQCRDALAEYVYYQTVWLPPRTAAQNAAINACFQGGDQAACMLMGQISLEIALKQQELAPTIQMLNTECTHIAGEPQGQGQGQGN